MHILDIKFNNCNYVISRNVTNNRIHLNAIAPEHIVRLGRFTIDKVIVTHCTLGLLQSKRTRFTLTCFELAG